MIYFSMRGLKAKPMRVNPTEYCIIGSKMVVPVFVKIINTLPRAMSKAPRIEGNLARELTARSATISCGVCLNSSTHLTPNQL